MFHLSTLGQILIQGAAILAVLQCLLPLHGYFRRNIYTLALARPLALVQSLVLGSAFVLLVLAFLSNDFSLAYVAANSSESLPFYYRLTAVWGAHEGSFLLWIFMLDLWTVALCFFSKHWVKEERSLSLSILGLISFCFLLFLNLTSDPFRSASNAMPQDLNPLLQDPGFFIHPPMLFAGYVGFSVVFAITMASLITQGPKMGALWASIIRPWALAAWSFLTIGITLGSWWAYHVLGWGGFWFWDPVENASLLPWLCGAALLHVAVIVEKQQRFSDWGIILAILCFSLSILGTFLVRSGVLISVHSFASDPSRGMFLLLLLGFITGTALTLYLLKRFRIAPNSKSFSFSAREGFLLVQSIFLFTAMATVLLGTLFPLISEASGLGTLSVGAPYFNRVLYPLLLIMMIFMALAPNSQWGSPFTKTMIRSALRSFLISLVLAIVSVLFFAREWQTLVIFNLCLVFWVLGSVSRLFFKQTAMSFAHLGFALVVMGIVFSSTFSTEREVRLHTGESIKLGPYDFHFVNIEGANGPNYRSIHGNFKIIRHGKLITTLQPEKRIYQVRDMVMTKAAIYPAVFHDLYIALGEPYSEDDWSMRIYYKPFIRWVWLGGFCIALGSLLSLLTYAGKRK